MYKKFVQLILNNNSKSIDQLFTYGVPDALADAVEIGKRVKVNFGNNKHMIDALIVSIDCSCQIPEHKIKTIIDVLDDVPVVSEEMIKLIFWIRERYICKYSDAIRLLIPAAIKYEHNIVVKAKEINNISLSDKEKELYNFIKDNPLELKNLKKHYTYNDIFTVIDNLKDKDAIEIISKDKLKGKEAYEKYVSLIEDKNINEYDINKTKNQVNVINYLKENKLVNIKKLSEDLGISPSVINNLIKKDILKEEYILYQIEEKNVIKNELKLNEEQKNACESIISSDNKVFLLHGVTGSGKTEVYMNIIEHYINENKQSIMLVPEISLTAQTIDRFEKRFGNKIAVFHSKLSKKEKLIQWTKVHNKEVDVVIGARSAVFSPIKDLGAIIIDEEHEDSYISSTSPKYNTIEVAIKMAHNLNSKVVLGSATPSINTYYMAQKGQIEIIELKNRVNNQMPDMKIIDMSSELDKGNNTLISEELYESMKKTLFNKEQAILFLNKRGYSGFVTCKKCGHVVKCDRCDVSMTYHIKGNMLKCHYCGRTKRMMYECPKCGSKKIEQFSAGTQHVERLVKQLFPNAVTERMDVDSMTDRDCYENIYRRFKNGSIDILIGTQMLAKGFDFPNVTTVGVLVADAILNLPFYNASEKTFQLITQVSGRAGRGSKTGNVFIQTYEPNNFIINAAKNNNYELFINEELKLRKEFAFPPFINIINICLISKNEDLVIKTANEKYEEIKEAVKDMVKERSLLLYRPIPHSIYKINDEYRINLFIKASRSKMAELKKILRSVYMDKDIEYIKVSININTDTV
ncbi:primosomal protein N' [Sedimentibacter hydroxybenzoicus DSM 7310]|uniref:Replication restart protein PriA n=1 Tax=Sedimentibacter hydroxybenzoicus DSM 7310 TaxID=1123245 RepID=A0A974BJC7_SEDHY|nr:primosomal protein N' [Sedimentibacter hydroxybenzoicus]NYB74143.1 primosomal protein N' [Sedimentibacter hydroxybenzoicus DSM 7310]